jgi:hypothetical protein
LAKRRKPIGAGIGTDVGKGLAESLEDYVRLPGTAQRYKNKRTGKVISRRQYENLRARSLGWDSWSEYQREAKKPDWIRWVGIEARREGLSATKKGNFYYPQFGMASRFAQNYIPLKRARDRDSSILYDPEGPLADWLVYLGLRQPDADWDVGETP